MYHSIAGSTAYHKWYINDTQKMTLDCNGNLGIGTATPGSLLDVQGTVTVGVDDTGYDVKLFGASAGAFMLYDESADTLDVRGATAAGPGVLKLTTGELTNVDGGILGRLEFQAPLDSAGTDAILVAASINGERQTVHSQPPVIRLIWYLLRPILSDSNGENASY